MNLISNKVWAALAVASLAATATQAASITGSLWVNQVSASQSATIKNIPTTTPDVTFSVNSPLNFNSYVGGYTVGGFLQSGGATILTGSDLSGHSLDNTFIAFMGQVTVANGETFTVTHDDGLQLKIGESLLINEPGPFAPTTDTWTYTGNPGTYPFVLTYG